MELRTQMLPSSTSNLADMEMVIWEQVQAFTKYNMKKERGTLFWHPLSSDTNQEI